jgi:hypothetical protein
MTNRIFRKNLQRRNNEVPPGHHHYMAESLKVRMNMPESFVKHTDFDGCQQITDACHTLETLRASYTGELTDNAKFAITLAEQHLKNVIHSCVLVSEGQRHLFQVRRGRGQLVVAHRDIESAKIAVEIAMHQLRNEAEIARSEWAHVNASVHNMSLALRLTIGSLGEIIIASLARLETAAGVSAMSVAHSVDQAVAQYRELHPWPKFGRHYTDQAGVVRRVY